MMYPPPLHYGFTLDRWLHSLHCMLLQKDKPYVDKLRIIQLIETDVNAALKILLNRRIMWYTIALGANSTQIYDGRQDRSTYDNMLIIQLSNAITRLDHSNLLLTFNDADGCYNRMWQDMCTIAKYQVGCTRLVA